MATKDNEELIRRWLKMAESGFGGNFNEYFTPDYTGHLSSHNPQTLDDLIRQERGFAASFSSRSYEINDLFAVEDRVVLRATIRAIHTGEFHGVGRTNRPVSFTAIVIYRIVGGKIAESWGELDFLGLFRQIRST